MRTPQTIDQYPTKLLYQGMLLEEVSRHTPQVEGQYENARNAFITAARELNQHRARFERRLALFEQEGGTSTLTPPKAVTVPTDDELQPVE
jgi:hypothetical protein